MYPSPFEYYRPSSVPDTIKLLQDNPEGKILAGGHSLLPMMKLRLANPAALIDIGTIDGLRGVTAEGDRIIIGPLTTYYDLIHNDTIRQTLPIIYDAASVVGDAQVRYRGTFGGSLAHADPASDMPAVALALDAQLKVIGPNGERTIPATEFLIDMFTTALEPDEVLTEIIIARPPARTGMTYLKFAHPASGYAIVGVAAVVTLGENGTVASARVAVTGAGPVARRATATEEAVSGQAPTVDTIKAAAAKAPEGMTFLGDIHASEDYRQHLVEVYVERALTQAVERARG